MPSLDSTLVGWEEEVKEIEIQKRKVSQYLESKWKWIGLN